MTIVGANLMQHVFLSNGVLTLYLTTLISLYCGATPWGISPWSRVSPRAV